MADAKVLAPGCFYKKLTEWWLAAPEIAEYVKVKTEQKRPVRLGCLAGGYDGLQQGWLDAGVWHVVQWYYDIDSKLLPALWHHHKRNPCKLFGFKAVHHLGPLDGDICRLNVKELDPVDFLAAGAPCQGFCKEGLQLGTADPRTLVFFKVLDVIDDQIENKGLQGFCLENAKEVTQTIGGLEAMSKIVYERMEKHKHWEVKAWILNALNHSQPESRHRWYCVGRPKDPSNVEFPSHFPPLPKIPLHCFLNPGLMTFDELAHYTEIQKKNAKDYSDIFQDMCEHFVKDEELTVEAVEQITFCADLSRTYRHRRW